MFSTRAWLVLYAGLVLTMSSSGNLNAASSDLQGEVSGTWQGRIETLIVDNSQAGTSRTRLFLHTSRETMEWDAAGDAALHAGQLVDITGRASGTRLAVSHASAPLADSGAGT